MEIALEFERISRLTESGKGNEARQAADALHAKYPKDGAANFIVALILAVIMDALQGFVLMRLDVNRVNR